MLDSRSFAILFLSSSLLHLACCRSYERGNGDNDFDLVIFTQQWPETVCSKWKEKVPSHRCLLPRRDEWTIHGIWPSAKTHGTGPAYCNSTQLFDPSALTPILNELDEKWINIQDGTPHFSFWKHEWEKHGTCASVLPEFNTEFKYFHKGLEFLNQYEMTRVLGKANILPGNNYSVQQIIDGVEKILEKHVQLTCVISPKTKESYIMEIRICLDKSLQLTDCDGVFDFPTNCNRKQAVNYPETESQAYNVILI